MHDDGERHRPESGYAADDFDRYYRDAAHSDELARMFHDHFDSTAPAEVQGFCFVTLDGLTRVADLLRDERPTAILDVGCGRGGPGLWLAERLGRPLYGVDVSAVAIAQAREAAARAGRDATFALGTLGDLRVASGEFAALVCIDALHYAGDQVSAARELSRVAAPGARLVATTWHVPDGPPRLRNDLPAALRQGGWSVDLVEPRPDWLAAQLRLYDAALAQPGWSDPAIQRLRDEGAAIGAVLGGGERLLVQARRL